MHEKALSVGLGGFMFNSFLVSLFSVFLIVVISGMAAYVLARVDFKINKYVYLLIVAGFAIPPAAVLVPLYVTVSNLGLLNSIYGIVMPLTAFGIPFTVILFYAFFLDFPREVEEAATIDGCSKIQIFYKIIIPLSGPAIASAAIFQTVWIWNEFLLALIMLTSDDFKTLPIVLIFAFIWLLPGYWLVTYGQDQVDPGRAGILLMFEVVIGIVSAYLLANEVITIREFLGALFVMSAPLIEIYLYQ